MAIQANNKNSNYSKTTPVRQSRSKSSLPLTERDKNKKPEEPDSDSEDSESATMAKTRSGGAKTTASLPTQAARQGKSGNSENPKKKPAKGSGSSSKANTSISPDTQALILRIKTLKNENKNLKGEISDLRASLERALKALKDGGKHMKEEVNVGIVKKLNEWVKKVGFVNTKFARDDDDDPNDPESESSLTVFTKKVHQGLLSDLDLDNKDSCHGCPIQEFVRICKGTVSNALSVRRQHVQSEGHKAMLGESRLLILCCLL